MPLPFSKPGKLRLRFIDGVKVLRDGREICMRTTEAGRREYKARTEAMRLRQGEVCCLYGHISICPGLLAKDDATFEHEDGRGMGGSKRDDRIEKDGKPYNGAAHEICNREKGSRFIDYNNRGNMQEGMWTS